MAKRRRQRSRLRRFDRSRGLRPKKLRGRQLRVEPLEDRRMLAVMTVTSLTDGTLAELAGDGELSLREAIEAINTQSLVDGIGPTSGVFGTDDEIHFEPLLFNSGPQAINLSAGELELTSEVAIVGPGAELLTIDAHQQSRVFNITATEGDFAFSGLTITGGETDGEGAGIRSLSSGLLLIVNSAVSDNTTSQGVGGVYTAGDVSLVDSAVTGNVGWSGGVFAGGEASLLRSLVHDNSGLTGDEGSTDSVGGVAAVGDIHIESSTVSNNHGGMVGFSQGRGGGVYSQGSVTVTESTISGNSSENEGAGIRAAGTVTLLGSTVATNRTESYDSLWYPDGGGISASSAVITNSLVHSNYAGGAGGAINASAVYLTNSTIRNNRAEDAGGIYANAATITNSTINGNLAGGRNDESGRGAAVKADSVTLMNATVVNNIFSDGSRGGAIQATTSVSITNSILTGTRDNGAHEPMDDVVGAITANYSLIGRVDLETVSGVGNLFGVDPLLGPLQDNGGFVLPDGSTIRTHALLPGSPAINAGDPNFDPLDPDGDPNTDDAIPFDQRGEGFPRVRGGRVDIGAFESNGGAGELALSKVADRSTVDAIGQVITYTLLVSNLSDVPLTGVSVEDPTADAPPVFVTGDESGNGALDVDEVWEYTAAYTVTKDDFDALTEPEAWNALDVPMLVMSPFLARTNRWGLLDANAIVSDAAAPTNYQPFANPNHPFVDGSTTSWTTPGATIDSLNSLAIPDGADLVATIDVAGAEHAAIVDIPAGAESFGHGEFGGRRTFFTTPEYPDVPNQDLDDVLTENAEQILADIVEQLAGVESANILVVSNADAFDDLPDDQALLDILTAAGHTIDADSGAFTDGPPTAQQLADVDVIVVSRAIQSGQYADSGIINTATATSFESAPATATAVVETVRLPAIALGKEANVSIVDEAGDVIRYTMTATNAGNVSLTDVVVSDPGLDAPPLLVGGDLDDDGQLDVDETWVYTGGYTVTQDDLEAGEDIVNTATAESSAPLPASATATVAVDQNPDISLSNSANPAAVNAVGQVITFTMIVENSGNVSLTEVVVSSLGLDAPPMFVGGDLDGDDRLDVDEVWVYSGNRTVTQQDLDAGTIVTEATVESAESLSESAVETVDVAQSPVVAIGLDIDIVSAFEELSPIYRNQPFLYAAGDQLLHTITLVNLGNVSLTDVTTSAVGADAPPVLIFGDTDGDDQLDVNEIWTLETTRTVTQAEIDARVDVVSTATVVTDQTALVADVVRTEISVPDFDDNKQVDGFDFLLHQRGFGKTENATQADGNADDDGDVDRGDLEAWEVMFGAPPPALDPNVFVVDTELDVVNATDGLTSLREAITRANDIPGPNEITFDFDHTGTARILLEQGEMVITDELTITGLGSDLLSIDAGHGADGEPGTLDGTRVFNIDDGTNNTVLVEISDLTITGGDVAGDGGGILNSEQLLLTGTIVTGNAARGGGGIFTNTGIELVDSQVTDNTAAFYSGGGVRSISGDVIITRSEISRNTAEWEFDPAPNGGGVSSAAGDVIVTDSMINDNATSGRGGGIDASGRVEVLSSTISGNKGEKGGGVYSLADIDLTDSDVVENEAASGSGGGISTVANVAISGGEVIRNTAHEKGGGVDAQSVTVNESDVSENASYGTGGGIHALGDVVVNDSSLSGNDARGESTSHGGGIFAGGDAEITGSNISGNYSPGNGGGVNAANVYVSNSRIERNRGDLESRGGGIFASGNVTVSDSEVTGNSVGDDGIGGGIRARDVVVARSRITASGGAAISSHGDVTVSYSEINGNAGGISARGHIDISFSQVSNNTLQSNTGFASIIGARSVKLTDVDVIGNSSIGIGAVDVEILDSTISGNGREGVRGSFIEVRNSIISGNSREGIDSLNHVTVLDSQVFGNGVGYVGSNSAGIRSRSKVTLERSAVVNNIGVGVLGTDIQVTASTVSGNANRVGGGGIRAYGKLTLDSSTISDNASEEESGGGIYSAGDVAILNSTISGNSAEVDGGGIRVAGMLSVINSTISGNQADRSGGGVFVDASGSASISHSTIANNEATVSGGGLFSSDVSFENVLIAGNSAQVGPDASGNIAASFSLFGESRGANITGSNNLTNVDVMLGPLADNGGFVLPDGTTIQTHALLEGSPAIDAGDPDFTPPPEFDQRGEGFDRVVGAQIDIGAFEVQAPAAVASLSFNGAGRFNPPARAELIDAALAASTGRRQLRGPRLDFVAPGQSTEQPAADAFSSYLAQTLQHVLLEDDSTSWSAPSVAEKDNETSASDSEREQTSYARDAALATLGAAVD